MQIQLLGHLVGNRIIKPDSEGIAALKDLVVPMIKKEQQRILGPFSYYAKRVANFSDIIQPLVQTKKFPLLQDAVKAFTGKEKQTR